MFGLKNMKERVIALSIAFVFGFTLICKAQKIEFSGSMIYGAYSMKDVSAFQQEVYEQLPVPAKIISDFPNYFGWELKAMHRFPKLSFGVYTSFHSTGSRISYNDYSGSFEYDQRAKITQLGLCIDYFVLPRENKWQAFLSLQVGAGWTNFAIIDKLVVNGQTLNNRNLDFKSSHITLQPGLGIKRNIGNFFISTQAAYLIDSASSLKDNADLKLISNDGWPIGVDWSGLRLSIGLGVLL